MGMKLDPEYERKLLAMPGVLVNGKPLVEVLAEVEPDAKGEEAFRQELRRYAKREGWRTYHTYSSKRSDPGFPDEVMLRGPVLLVVECKRSKKEKPTEAQEEWLSDFRQVPGCVVRVWSPEDWPEIRNLLGGVS